MRNQRRNDLKYRYDITPEEYERLFYEQDCACGICRKPCPTGRRLAVDHDHTTGTVRGLLCSPCNTALGHYEKILEDPRALAYVQGVNGGKTTP